MLLCYDALVTPLDTPPAFRRRAVTLSDFSLLRHFFSPSLPCHVEMLYAALRLSVYDAISPRHV